MSSPVSSRERPGDAAGLSSGLCSVTLRALPAEAVIALSAAAGLKALEWGGDVHLPPGDAAGASRLRRACDDAGLACPSYGSYLQAGSDGPGDTARALDTADALGAPNVRVWCRYGTGPSADERTRARVTAGVEAIAAAAESRHLSVSLEYHPDTLTETAESATRLLGEVGAPNLFIYWQPRPGCEPAQARAEVEAVGPWLSHVHVFRWTADGTRLALADGEGFWPPVLAAVSSTPTDFPHPRAAFLEFVRDDDPGQLAADAATLRAWLGGSRR